LRSGHFLLVFAGLAGFKTAAPATKEAGATEDNA
jgi:hypothetical protein